METTVDIDGKADSQTAGQSIRPHSGKPFTTSTYTPGDIFDYIKMFYNPKLRHGFNNKLSPVNYGKQYFEWLASV